MESPTPMTHLGTLGTLTLVGRKDGRDLHTFPIDSERVTIGRDYECDIRLYFSDVSKLHCEVVFDLLTDKASLHIHGSNGVYYTPSGGEATFHSSKTVLPLLCGDQFIIRKKVFRFNYAATATVPAVDSPLKPAMTPSVMTPSKAKRLSSHRLSLVPMGKTFTPHTPSKAPPAFGASEECEEELVDIVEGEEGDRVYVEVKENQEIEDDAAPMTPSPTTPSRPTAKTALSTPKGSASLRKSLLLRSARKAWKDTQSPGLEGAIEEGAVQVRRRSSSRSQSSQSPIAAPAQDEEEAEYFVNVQYGAEDSDEAEEEEEVSDHIDAPPKIRIGHESMGQEPETWENEDLSDGGEDEPGSDEEAMLDEQVVGDDDEEAVGSDGFAGNDLHEEMEPVEEIHAGNIVVEGEEEDEAEEGQEDGGEEEDESMPTCKDETSEDTSATPLSKAERRLADSPQVPPLPGTPAAAAYLNRFYTPQPKRAQTKASILGTVGPAVRFKPLPATPNFDRGLIQAVPRSGLPLGPPVRPERSTPKVVRLSEDEVKPAVASSAAPVGALVTPDRRAIREEAKRRRQSLATPRNLPAPPAGGFRASTSATPKSSSLVQPSVHTPRSFPFMASTEEEKGVKDASPRTPLVDIRRRLEEIRQKTAATASRAERRMTTGFGAPSTPSHLGQQPRFSHTEAISRISQPLISRRDVHVVEIQTPTRILDTDLDGPSTAAMDDILPRPRTTSLGSLDISASDIDADTSLRSASPPSTPLYNGIKSMMIQPKPMPTPNFAGLKQMLAEPRVPPTPSFVGVRDMFRVPAANASLADLEGVAAMFEDVEEEAKSEHRDEMDAKLERSEELADTIEVAELEGARAVQLARQVRRTGPTATDVKPSASSKIPVKRGRPAKAAGAAKDEEPQPVKRNRVVEEPSSSAPSRTSSSRARRAATVEREELAMPKTISRTRTRAFEKDPLVLQETEPELKDDDKKEETSKPSKRKVAPGKIVVQQEQPSKSTRTVRAKKAEVEKENEPEPAVKVSKRAAARKATEVLAETSASSRSTRSRR